MYRTGSPGRMARIRAATSLPSISGMTASVSSRSMGWSRSLAWMRVSDGVVAIALNTSGFRDVVGTIAGDDTVFIAAHDPARARGINRRLNEMGVARQG